jgi:hypothetical protein
MGMTVPSAASLLLCVTITILWARSHVARDSLAYWGKAHAGRCVFQRIDSRYGSIDAYGVYEYFPPEQSGTFGQGRYPPPSGDWACDSEPLGVADSSWFLLSSVLVKTAESPGMWDDAGSPGTTVARYVRLPHWLFVLVFAATPTMWFRRWRKRLP